MNKSSPLYNALHTWLNQSVPWVPKRSSDDLPVDGGGLAPTGRSQYSFGCRVSRSGIARGVASIETLLVPRLPEREYREMLYQAAHRLPEGVNVFLLADRGFIHI